MSSVSSLPEPLRLIPRFRSADSVDVDRVTSATKVRCRDHQELKGGAEQDGNEGKMRMGIEQLPLEHHARLDLLDLRLESCDALPTPDKTTLCLAKDTFVAEVPDLRLCFGYFEVFLREVRVLGGDVVEFSSGCRDRSPQECTNAS